MINRKIIIYRKHSDKPIVLTDNVDNVNNIYKDMKTFEKIFTDTNENNVVTLEFDNDFLILDPTTIDCIIISKPEIKDVDLLPEDENKKLSKKKEPEFDIEDDNTINVLDDDDNEITNIKISADELTDKVDDKGDTNLESTEKVLQKLKTLSGKVDEEDIEIFLDEKEELDNDETKKPDDVYTGIE